MMVGDRKGPPGSIWRLPGYGGFFLAATLGRVADEMLAIAVVLLVLDRTSSPALAGATVAAASLPSVLTGPVLGAWLDRTRHRRAALAANQVLLAAALLGMLLAAGRAPAWVVPALAVVGGIGAPMLTGGITSMIPLLVPPGLLSRANALEAASFNSAAVLGPALAATAAARFGPATAVALEAGIALVGLAAIARMRPLHATDPTGQAPPTGPAGPAVGPGGTTNRAGPAGTTAPAGTSLGAALRAGLAHLARTPVLRGVTVTSSLAMGAQGLLPIAFPLLSERLGAGRGAAGYLFAALFAVRQQWSPGPLRGQVFTTGASLKIGAYAIGAAVAGPTLAGIGPRGAVATTAGAELLAVLTGLGASRGPIAARYPSPGSQAALQAEDDWRPTIL